jgi:tripartite-type tricarboxylate transporter receptor subunit TctC
LFLLLVLFFGINELIPRTAEAAESHPSRPIQLIVPFPPGGLTDLVGRPFASSLEKVLKDLLNPRCLGIGETSS